MATSGNFHLAKTGNFKLAIDNVGGLFRNDRRLYVKGRDRTKTVQNMAWQVEAVRSALAEFAPEVPLHAALCFVEAEWRLFAKPFTIEGVRVSGPKSLAAVIDEEGPLGTDEVLEVASELARAFPSKGN